MTIGQQIYNGIGAAAWVLGFLFLLLGAVVAMILICYGVLLIAQTHEDKPAGNMIRKAGIRPGRKTESEEVRRDAGTTPPRFYRYGDAYTAGRHAKKGA